VIGNAVMNAHPFSANATENATLQKCWAFACRTGLASSSESQRVLGEPFLIDLKLFPGNIAGVNPGNHELPLRSRNFHRAVLAVGQTASAHAAIDEGSGVARIMKHLEDSRVRRSHPVQLAFVQALANAARESKALLVEQPRRLHRLIQSDRTSRRPMRIAACISPSGSRIRTPSSR